MTSNALDLLLTHATLVPEEFVIEPHARHDLLGEEHLSVRVRPRDVDADTFRFGTPGAVASITAVQRDDQAGYHVHVFSTACAWTFQQAGHAVLFTDPADAVRTAVWQVRSEVESQNRAPR